MCFQIVTLLLQAIHYFISDLPKGQSSVIILKADEILRTKAEVLPYETSAWSAENIIYNVFGMRTTRNYYFEKDISELLQLIELQDVSPDRTQQMQYLVTKLRKYSFNDADPLNDILHDAEELIR